MNILLTGGAGYIGSHTAVVLSEAGHEVIIFDNFCNSKKNILKRLKKILGAEISCVEGDIRDTPLISKTLQDRKIDAVIHFAGLKAVSESIEKPIEYYANNVMGTISLIEAMKLANVKTLVFSSSATVYGNPEYLPIDENHPTTSINVYGRSKLHIEEMLKDIANSDADWRIACLRYFNPVGAHESGLIGEDPNGMPNNLMPYIAQVAAGRLPYLNIYGDDYPTLDGTGVRDYIHVMDLAAGHVAAVKYLNTKNSIHFLNLGTGTGHTVFEMIRAFEYACGTKVPFQISSRRFGDVSSCYADVTKAKKDLNWTARLTIQDMCTSIWNFQKRNLK